MKQILILALILFSTLKASDRELVEPYFDQEYYLNNYQEMLAGSNLEPIDHFLSVDFKAEWYRYTDPNNWFNTALYLRTFSCEGNPFVDFLKQPALSISYEAPCVDVFAKENELVRAWLAVEALLRLNEYFVVLHLSPDLEDCELLRFAAQVKRGLQIEKDNSKQFSFLQSPFLQHPMDHAAYPSWDWNRVLSLWDHDPRLLVHRAYSYNSWLSLGRINPLRLNIFHYVDEPHFSTGVYSLEMYIRKIREGFDLIFCPIVLGKNVRVIPGYMQIWVNPEELSLRREYSVSYLLSTGFQGMSPSWNYLPRIYVWNHENDLGMPTRFYISRRSINQFPSELHARCLPTDSKAWIFDSQFSIAIENNRQVNYMTEKLLDCFVSLTVPIYLGCPNVRDYFDERGMFIVESAEEIVQVCRSITPQTYQSMLPYLLENRKRAYELLGLERRLIQELVDSMQVK